jgi:hypothetical protein
MVGPTRAQAKTVPAGGKQRKACWMREGLIPSCRRHPFTVDKYIAHRPGHNTVVIIDSDHARVALLSTLLALATKCPSPYQRSRANENPGYVCGGIDDLHQRIMLLLLAASSGSTNYFGSFRCHPHCDSSASHEARVMLQLTASQNDRSGADRNFRK